MKSNLTKEQMAVALFALCSDVSLLKAQGVLYYYFKPIKKANAQAIQYLLRKNGIRGQRHNSQYYASLDTQALVVRVPKNVFENQLDSEFKHFFETAYSVREQYVTTKASLSNVVDSCFWMRTKNAKTKKLSAIAEFVR